jgi:uncharacterized protein (DUF2235 family)
MRLVLEQSAEQLIYYDEGVGTERFERISGGALAKGLSAKVLGAYLWLMENYRTAEDSLTGDSDQIYIFGFSRGAYTARSLVGLLSLCGLVRRDAPTSVLNAFMLSRTRDYVRSTPPVALFRRECSDEVRVRFLGLWDTVAALGIHKLDLPLLERYHHHKAIELHDIVENCRHALALDEHRALFAPTLFPSRSRQGQTLEQRWFTGSHANVGGGYDRDGLFLRPLQWMIDEAVQAQLVFKRHAAILPDAFYRSTVTNSLEETALGAYYATQGFKRFDRRLTFRDATEQTLDFTVIQRLAWDHTYKPPALAKLLAKPVDRTSSFRADVSELLRRVQSVQLSQNPLQRDAFIV